MVATPITFRFLVVVRPATPNVAMVATPITFRFVVVVRPVTPNVAMVDTPVASKSLVFNVSVNSPFRPETSS